LAALLQSLDLVVVNVPEFETSSGRFGQGASTSSHFWKWTFNQFFLCPKGKEILLLSGDKFRTIEGKKRFSLLDKPACEINKEVFDPSPDLG
jgi:hypothetical protein